MKRKQFTTVLLSMVLTIAVCLPLNSVSVQASETAEAGTTEFVVSTVPEEAEEVQEVVMEEIISDDPTETEENQAPESEEVQASESDEAQASEFEEAYTSVVEEAQNTDTEEETQPADVSEITEDEAEISTFNSNGNDAQASGFDSADLEGIELPEVSIQPVEVPYISGEFAPSLPASAKVTATNVASGLKVRWEPVPDAREYVVYRGSKQIKRTSKTEITDTDVKYNNGSKYTYKVAAVSKNGTISKNVRTSTYYRLLPVGITSLKSTAAGKMTVTYDKNAKGSGYVVRFGHKSDMSDAKVITVTDPATTTKTFTGLKEGKTYYVQARSYKIENGKRYYSGYCTTKSVTIANSASSAQISFSGSRTIAVGTTRRLYVKNAGSAMVSVSKSSEAVKISKDSTSYIITGNKAGSVNVNVTAGSVKKSFTITVLSDDEIAKRVYDRVVNDCPGCKVWGHEREGKVLVISMHIKSIGEGAIASDIRVNLQTGSAVVDLDQEFMDEWNIGIPKSFTVW